MSNKREQIEEAAVSAIQRGGLGSVSFRTLAESTGIKSASVHYHFPQKSDLVDALIERYRDTFREVLAGIDREASSLADALDRFIHIFEAVVADDRICMCGMLAAESETVPEPTRQRLGGFFSQLETWLIERFGKHDAELNGTLSPEQRARILLAGLEGAAMIDRADGRTTYLGAQRALVEDWLR